MSFIKLGHFFLPNIKRIRDSPFAGDAGFTVFWKLNNSLRYFLVFYNEDSFPICWPLLQFLGRLPFGN